MLSIIRCFEKCDLRLRNVKFGIRIDLKNLKYSIENQIRWSLILSKYDFVINYITGKKRTNLCVFQAEKKTYLMKTMTN